MTCATPYCRHDRIVHDEQGECWGVAGLLEDWVRCRCRKFTPQTEAAA